MLFSSPLIPSLSRSLSLSFAPSLVEAKGAARRWRSLNIKQVSPALQTRLFTINFRFVLNYLISVERERERESGRGRDSSSLSWVGTTGRPGRGGNLVSVGGTTELWSYNAREWEKEGYGLGGCWESQSGSTRMDRGGPQVGRFFQETSQFFGIGVLSPLCLLKRWRWSWCVVRSDISSTLHQRRV